MASGWQEAAFPQPLQGHDDPHACHLSADRIAIAAEGSGDFNPRTKPTQPLKPN